MLDIISRGHEKVIRHIENTSQLTKRGIRHGFFKLGASLKADLNKEVLKKNKTGRVYHIRSRGGARRRHRASAPGQTPANRTGNYRRNIGFQIRGTTQMEFGIRDGAEYAKFLESGTKNMAPRPGIGNTVNKQARNAEAYFVSSIKANLT